MLQEATLYKMETRREELLKKNKQNEGSGVEAEENEDEAVTVAMLADLQELQDLEVETYIQQMPDMVRKQ